MDFSLFPVEIIEEVALYLSPEDLITCLLVNKQWNIIFDDDIVWKRKCTFHPNYFNKQITKHVHSSNNSNSKRNVFRGMQVGKNILKGKYDVVRIDIGRLYCDNLLDFVDRVGNHWLFISCAEVSIGTFQSSHLIKVWNMTGEPTIHQTIETPLGITNRLIDSQMRVIDNKLLYMVNDTLIAFEFSQPEYFLNVLYQVSCPRFEEIKTESAMIYKGNRIFGFVHTRQHVLQSAKPWVHVWDEHNTMIYKNYSADEVDQMRVAMNANEKRGILQPLLKVRDGDLGNVILLYNAYTTGHVTFVVVSFSVESFQYTTLFVKSSARQYHFFDVVNKIVFFEYAIKTFIHRLSCCHTDGQMIYETMLKNRYFNLEPYISISDEGKEVMISDDFGRVTVFDVFQSKVMCRLKILRYGFGLFIKSNILIVQNHGKQKTTYGVWDFKHGKHLYNLDKLNSVVDPFVYRFAFTKVHCSPPKIFAIKEPGLYYCQDDHEGEIVMISFL